MYVYVLVFFRSFYFRLNLHNPYDISEDNFCVKNINSALIKGQMAINNWEISIKRRIVKTPL